MRTPFVGETSYRRWLVNDCLSRQLRFFSESSIVLDVGGKNSIGPKGFQYPTGSVSQWINLNIDPMTRPDFVADANIIPLQADAVDVVVCTEVLEHLQSPRKCIREISRVLKSGGVFIGSAPFVFPVHGDPNDYYRFTQSGLRCFFDDFSIVNIEPMGGAIGTVGMLIEQEFPKLVKTRLMRSMARRLGQYLAKRDIKNDFEGADKLTTGWFWVCVK